MAKVTKVKVRRCGVYDPLLGVKCNQPRHQGNSHRFVASTDLQFTWVEAEKENVKDDDEMYDVTAGGCW